jgi:hypothetical protein
VREAAQACHALFCSVLRLARGATR